MATEQIGLFTFGAGLLESCHVRRVHRIQKTGRRQYAAQLPAFHRPARGGFGGDCGGHAGQVAGTGRIPVSRGRSGNRLLRRAARRGERPSRDRRRQRAIIHVFRTGDSFAEVALAAPTGYPADARALEPTQVLLVQKDGILALLKRQPELALRMLGSMSSHLRVLVGQIEDLTVKDVETRLANWLVKRCPNPQSETPMKIELTVAKGVLAAELGTVSETFSRTLAKFREQRLITVKGKTVTVLSPAKLNALLLRNLGE